MCIVIISISIVIREDDRWLCFDKIMTRIDLACLGKYDFLLSVTVLVPSCMIFYMLQLEVQKCVL